MDALHAHEIRISRLEETSAQIRAGLAANTAELAALTGKVEDGFKNTNAKLDRLIETLIAQDKRLAVVETDTKRAKWWLGSIGTAVAAVIGWIAQAFIKARVS
jgi:hypothetical protein